MSTDNTKSLKIRDKVIVSGQLLKVIGKEMNHILGKEIEVFCLEPYFKDNTNNTLVFKIPVVSLENQHARVPFTKKEFREFLRSELKKDTQEPPATHKDASAMLNAQGIHSAISILKSIWVENTKNEYLTRSKKDIFGLSLKRLVEEYAFAAEYSLEKAEKNLTKFIKEELSSAPPAVTLYLN